MMKLWSQLKTVRFSVWFLCVFIIYLGICYIHFLKAPMSESEIESRKEQHYDNFYNKVRPNEKMPIYDYSAWGLVKRDGRYFLIPKEYAGASGFHFYWPLSLQKKYSTAIYDNPIDGQRRSKASIEVFINSKYFGRPDYIPKLPEQSCVPENTQEQGFLWNGLKIHFRFDESYQKDWPQICLEALRILNQVKEVKP